MRQQGVEQAMDIRTDRQAEDAVTAVEGATFVGEILEGQNVVVRKNSGGTEAIRPRLNFIEGANIVITLADDPVGSETDLTFALPASPDVATSYKVGGTKVIGAQGAVVADVASPDASDLATVLTLANEIKTQLNLLLARERAHGLIA